MVDITSETMLSAGDSASVNYHLQALNISFSLANDTASKFPGFLKMLEQKYWALDTPLESRLDLLKRTVCNFTWQKLQEVASNLETSWIDDARVECEDNPYMPRAMTMHSPLLRRTVRVNRNLSEDFRPQLRWPEVRRAFVTRLMRDSNVDTKKAVKNFPTLTDLSNARHAQPQV